MIWTNINENVLDELIAEQYIQPDVVYGGVERSSPMVKYVIPMKYGRIIAYTGFDTDDYGYTSFFQLRQNKTKRKGQFLPITYKGEKWYLNNNAIFRLGSKLENGHYLPEHADTKTYDEILTRLITTQKHK